MKKQEVTTTVINPNKAIKLGQLKKQTKDRMTVNNNHVKVVETDRYSIFGCLFSVKESHRFIPVVQIGNDEFPIVQEAPKHLKNHISHIPVLLTEKQAEIWLKTKQL